MRRYAEAMKTTVSIPNALFREADALACRRGITRSQLYAVALKQYLDSQARKAVWRDITGKLNRAYQNEESALDPFLTYAAFLTFKRAEW